MTNSSGPTADPASRAPTGYLALFYRFRLAGEMIYAFYVENAGIRTILDELLAANPKIRFKGIPPPVTRSGGEFRQWWRFLPTSF